MVSKNLMQADGIHPNIQGHELVEIEVRNKLLPLLDCLITIIVFTSAKLHSLFYAAF